MENNQPPDFEIAPGEDAAPPVIVAGVVEPDKDGFVSVNLKYFQKKTQCFGDWVAKELKGFSSWNEKMSARTLAQVLSWEQCHGHKGKRGKGYALPDSLSEDLKFYSIRVNDKARVHGFFSGNQFYLVWLDRNHECLPE